MQEHKNKISSYKNWFNQTVGPAYRWIGWFNRKRNVTLNSKIWFIFLQDIIHHCIVVVVHWNGVRKYFVLISNWSGTIWEFKFFFFEMNSFNLLLSFFNLRFQWLKMKTWFSKIEFCIATKSTISYKIHPRLMKKIISSSSNV